MTLEEAKIAVLAELREEFGPTVELDESAIIEKDYGWVFVYNSKKYFETRDPLDGLMSNTPFIFTRDGKKCFLIVRLPMKEAIEEAEQRCGLKA